MRALFDVCNAINTTKSQPHFTAVLMSVRDHFLGICAEELKDSGLVNAKAAEENKSPCDPVRTVVWQKTNKFGQRGGQMGYDTEFISLGFRTADGGLPDNPFNEWGPDPHPKSSVLHVPCVNNKYQWSGSDLNATEVNPFLAYLVSIYQILIFITRSYCINS